MATTEISLGSYAVCRPTHIIVQVISSPYTVEGELVTDVRLVFDPMITFTAKIDELELINELQ